jgi:hypothetical protein
MRFVHATFAKQKFRETIELSKSGPVGIQRHGETVAVIAPVEAICDAQIGKRMALQQQKNVEADRLIRHQRIAIRLLTNPAQAPAHIESAKKLVARWEQESLCSDHYISRWKKALSLPVAELAIEMSGEMDGWGTALRQNSPWPMTI